MNDSQYLTNQFLIAMPGLEDPNFFHSVTYICEHNDEGALGLVINRQLDMQLPIAHVDDAKVVPIHTEAREVARVLPLVDGRRERVSVA